LTPQLTTNARETERANLPVLALETGERQFDFFDTQLIRPSGRAQAVSAISWNCCNIGHTPSTSLRSPYLPSWVTVLQGLNSSGLSCFTSRLRCGGQPSFPVAHIVLDSWLRPLLPRLSNNSFLVKWVATSSQVERRSFLTVQIYSSRIVISLPVLQVPLSEWFMPPSSAVPSLTRGSLFPQFCV
jgi:hypothetical protein